MFTLWSIFKAGLLVANAGVIPHKQRFLARCEARAPCARAGARLCTRLRTGAPRSCLSLPLVADGWDEPDGNGATLKNQVGARRGMGQGRRPAEKLSALLSSRPNRSSRSCRRWDT